MTKWSHPLCRLRKFWQPARARRSLFEFLFKFLNKTLGLPAQLTWHFDLEQHMQVAAFLAIEVRQPLLLHRQHGAWLGACVKTEFHRALVGQLHAALAPERCLGKADFFPGPDVEAIALKAGIWLELHVDIQIARLRAGLTGHTLAGDAQPLTTVDPCGKGDQHLAAFLHVTL